MTGEPLVRLAEELERRDGRAVAELAEVEQLAAQVEQVRAEAGGLAATLRSLPAWLDGAREELRAAESARASVAEAAAAAEAALRRVEERGREDERLAASRTAQHARDALHDADLRLERAGGEIARLEGEREASERRAAGLEQEARELAVRIGGVGRVAHEAVAAPEDGLEGLLAWCSRARGGLLLAQSAIATERERLAREAADLLGAVTGDPLALGGVAGVRERVSRELRRS